MDNVKKVMGSGKHERCHNSLQNGGNIISQRLPVLNDSGMLSMVHHDLIATNCSFISHLSL